MPARRRSGVRRGRGAALGLLAVLCLGPAPAAAAGPPVVAVVGASGDGRRLQSAREGAEAAVAVLGADLRIEVHDDEGSPSGLRRALQKARRARPVAWIAVPGGDVAEAWHEAARGLKAPVFLLDGAGPDARKTRGNVLHLGPSPTAQAVCAADGMLAPLAARRVAVVHEPTPYGRTLASAFARSLSRFVTLTGVIEWDEHEAAAGARSLATQEADWVYAALGGRWAVSFVEALRAEGVSRRCLFADGNRAASLLARAPDVLEGSVFVGGPDPELFGRQGEDLVATLLDKGFPVDVQACRAFEAVRRVERARKDAGSDNPAKIAAAVSATTGIPGVFGPLAFEPHGGVRRFPFTWWRAREGRIELWQDDLLPTPDCGPPLGFGHPPPSEVNEARGRIGFLTYGEGETRTIEQDLLELGLSTGGVEPDLDAALRDEILHRAIRVAHQLFRREVDGAAVPGWSWGMSFTTALPEDRPRSKTWAGIVAGDHPAAGGQVIGSGLVAIYATFLKRTMYLERTLDPPLSAADRPLLDGTYRWGTDRTLNFRANKLRCLLDGFASAVGLTLSHEFGHLCGCGHDTEHPTSIMNVVAGAGASWEEAVWIPDHQKSVTTTLGIDEP